MSDQQKLRVVPAPGRRAEELATPPAHLLPGESQNAELERALRCLRTHHDAIQGALTPLEEAVENLAKDWGTRGWPFWKRLLHDVSTLRDALRAGIAWSSANPFDSQVPLGLVAVRYQMLLPLSHAERQIDTVGISITAYMPVCESQRHSHLQQRQDVLADVRELVQRTQEALTATGPQMEERCRREQHRSDEALVRWAQRHQGAQEPEEEEEEDLDEEELS